MTRSHFLIILLTTLCLFIAVIVFSYYHFIRVDVECQHFHADVEHACYSMNLFGIIPIANLQVAINPPQSDGTITMTMTLESIGIARRAADMIRFDVTSTFGIKDHLPLSFSISQYDESRLRSTKTTTYNFSENILQWKSYSPLGRNRKYEDRVIYLNSVVYSPLSAVYHVLNSYRNKNSNEELPLYIQAKSHPYVLRKTRQNLKEISLNDNKAGKIRDVYFYIRVDPESREKWRREKGFDIRLYFFQDNNGLVGQNFFPIKVTLAFHLITLNKVDSGKSIKNSSAT